MTSNADGLLFLGWRQNRSFGAANMWGFCFITGSSISFSTDMYPGLVLVRLLPCPLARFGYLPLQEIGIDVKAAKNQQGKDAGL